MNLNLQPRRIDVLAFHDVQLLDVAGPLQVFATANDQASQAGLPQPYLPRVIAAQAGQVMSSAGVGLSVYPLPTHQEPSDTLLIAGGRGVHAASLDTALVAWVQAHAGRSRRVASPAHFCWPPRTGLISAAQ